MTQTLTLAESVTTTSVNLGDGFFISPTTGALFSNAITTRTLKRWPNPLDLATSDGVTYANDGKHTGSVGMLETGGFIYHCFTGYQAGDDFYYILISKVDPSTLAVSTFVDYQLYDGNVFIIGPGACNICTDGTHLYLITHTDRTFGPDTKVYKFLLADGSLVGSREITGFQRGHAIAYDSATSCLYGGGTSPVGTGWAFKMAADLGSHSTASLAVGSCTVCDDIVIYGDYFWLQDETKTNPARIWRVKKSDLSIDTITLTGGGTSAACDGFLDNTASDGTIWVGMRDGDKIATVNATSLVEGDAFTTTGVTKINEILRDGTNIYVATYESSSKVARFTLGEAAANVAVPVAARVGYF
jgi:hypothetical protein